MELDKAIKIFEEGMHKNICKHQEFAFCHDEDGAFYHARLAEEHAQMAEWLRELKRLRAGKRIPVSERLPEEGKTVMASTNYGIYPEARYSKKYGWEWPWEAGADYWTGIDSVEAWMELPEPYKVEREDEE
jgi:hypothetical protein